MMRVSRARGDNRLADAMVWRERGLHGAVHVSVTLRRRMIR